MAKKDMDDFIDTLRSDGELARAFAEAVAGMARDAGHDVTEEDVLEKFVDGDTPSPRPLPGDDGDFDGGITTAAIGEEGSPRPSTEAVGEEGGRGSPSVTLAIGEEDRPTKPGPRPRPPGGITTMAMGEEGGRRF
ncbi:MAG: hypothetical protein ACAH80_02840 [Alphaproteobacteria bacterium]